MISDDYYYLKPDELEYCFRQAKRGVYGKVFDRIDGMVILEWLEKYNTERMEICMAKSDAKEAEATEPVLHNKLMPALKKMGQSINPESKISDKKVAMGANLVNQFYSMKDNQNRPDGKVELHGQVFSMEQFLDYKLKNNQ